MTKNLPILGVAWFSPHEWQKLKVVADDTDELHDTYDDWVRDAEMILREVTANGLVAKKVETTVEELQRWCTENRCRFDRAARAKYAAYKLEQQGLSLKKAS